MLHNSIIAIYFSVNSRAVCDYAMKLAMKMAENNLVIALLIYADPHPLLKSLFIKKQRPVIYKEKGIYFCRPIYLLPFQRFAMIERWNRLLFLYAVFPLVTAYIRYKYYKKPVGKKQFFFFYHPQKEKEHFQMMYRYFFKRSTTIFDIVDYPDIQNDQERSYFERFIRNTDVVVVNSHTLCKRFSPIRGDITVVPQGFALDEFQHPKAAIKFPRGKPMIGFVGSIGSKIDFSLLFHLIERKPQYQFVFWGPKEYVKGENIQELSKNIFRLSSYNNVVMGQSKVKREIPSIIRQFDLCTIPYNTSIEAVRYSYPMKLFEYFYMGKAVVSTPIEELKRFPKYVRIGSTVEEWERQIKDLLSRPWPQQYQEAQRRLAMENSWERKVEAISRELDKKDIVSYNNCNYL